MSDTHDTGSEGPRPDGGLRPHDGLQPLDEQERMTLVELVNRVLDKGVIVTGEVVIGIGGVDLIYLGLQLVLSSVDTLEKAPHVRSIRLPQASDRPRAGQRLPPAGDDDASGAGD